MAGRSVPPPPSASLPADSGVWDRITKWASENKAVVYTLAGFTLVVTGAGVVYYAQNNSSQESGHRPSKKDRRKKKQEREEASATGAQSAHSKSASVESVEELPDVDEEYVSKLSDQQRKELASKLKVAGNKSYNAKDFDKAIDLYTKAILCRQDPVFYSNRAACYSALTKWENVIEDTTAALNLDPEYVKALNRRANAYDKVGQYSEALLDFTASCIIDGFRNQQSAEAVERLLKKYAESKAKEILKSKPPKLPSPTFVGHYLDSFRSKSRPEGLDESIELSEDTGRGQLQLGLRSLEKKTVQGYEEAARAFEKALELNDLGDLEAFAYNMRGTFRCLMGRHEEALKDLTKSIGLDPNMTQNYIKRGNMRLEIGNVESAEEDFSLAIEKNQADPDIYYHRAQLSFLRGDFPEASKDYQKSIDLDQDFIFSHIQLGLTQYKMGSVASSMATFRRCVKNFEKTPDVYNYFGELLLDQGNYQEAIEQFDAAIEMAKQANPMNMNVLPLINKSLALFHWKQDFGEAEKLFQKALIIDPECDIAVAALAQLLLQQGKVTEALKYFERAAELARTEGELVNAISYAEATRTQIQVQEKYPQLASKLQGMAPPGMGR